MHLGKNNLIKNWWRGVDQQAIIALAILISFSLMLVTTTSSAVAEKIGLIDNYFSSRQVIYLIVATIFIVALSSIDKKWVKRLGILGFLFSILMLILVKFYGYEVKGATRWISIASFSYQPSEFIKPFFAIVTGWILSLRYEDEFPSFRLCVALYGIVATLLIIKPDFGMLVHITPVFGTHLFIAGMPIIWIIIVFIVGAFGA